MGSIRISTLLGWIALAVIAFGVAIGFAVPVHIAGAAGESCGTAFRPSYDWATTLGASECAAALDTPRLVAFVIIGVGLVIGVAAYVIGLSTPREPAPGPAPSAVEPSELPRFGNAGYWRSPFTIGAAITLTLVVGLVVLTNAVTN